MSGVHVCTICGRPQAARCEGGEIDYLAGPEPCPLKGRPKPYAQPEHKPTPQGLEDLL